MTRRKTQKALARQRRPYVEAVVFLSRGGVLKVALDPSRNERIGREGEVLGVLRHPNIVAFYRHVERVQL